MKGSAAKPFLGSAKWLMSTFFGGSVRRPPADVIDLARELESRRNRSFSLRMEITLRPDRLVDMFPFVRSAAKEENGLFRSYATQEVISQSPVHLHPGE
jgi:hypothetical protein